MIHVLYIEDDELLARSTLRFFRRYYPSAVVTHVSSYGIAVTYLRSIQFDVVLSDFDLAPGDAINDEGAGGDGVLAWIEQHQPHVKQRFIFLSGNVACAERGVQWLLKPCSLAALATTIADVLRGGTP